MTDELKPFIPPAPMFADPPVGKESEKRPRKKRGPNKPKADKPVGAKKKRKARTVGKHPALAAPYGKSPKFSLGDALAIGALLEPEDLKLFGQIETDLRAASKAARSRILVALGRVFE